MAKWQAFDYIARNIFVRCTVSGANGFTTEADFILDTGNNRTTLDSSFAQKLGLSSKSTTRTQTPTGTTFQTVLDLPLLRLGADEKKHIQVSAADLSRFTAGYKHNVDGFLGTDFLTDKILSLDFPKRRFSLDPTARAKGASLLDLDATPFSGLLLVPVTLPNRLTMLVIIDTGSDHPSEFMFYKDALYAVAFHPTGTSDTGDLASTATLVTRGYIETISLGSLVIQRPSISVLEPVTVNPYGTKFRPGLLNCQFFERYYVQIDFLQHRLKLAIPLQE